MRGVLLAVAVVVVVGAATSWFVASRRDAADDEMRDGLAADLEQGGLAGLVRAQARARRLLVADPADLTALDALAFASAVLAVDYGADTTGEVGKLLARGAAANGGGRERREATGVAAAARALLLLAEGDPDGAARVAVAAAKAFPEAPHPLYALGRARARAGDLAGASRALEAALVEAPGFTMAQVAWAEAQLDAGDAQAAREALSRALARSGEDPRSRLLWGEAERALGATAPTDDGAVCATPAARNDGASPRWPPAAIRAGCALARATRERMAGRRAEARAHAEEAAREVPAEPRLLARTAQLLAELGAVDGAAGLLERARRLASSEAPALAWASAAVELGRGHTPVLPGGARPAAPEARLLIARAALSAGGAGALRAVLGTFGAAAWKGDADLSLLARLFGDPPPRDATTPREDPWRAYLDGLRAELAGDLAGAAASFGRALSGHGDACRAAGEYLATLRLLKRPDDPVASGALTALRAENARCVNLRRFRALRGGRSSRRVRREIGARRGAPLRAGWGARRALPGGGGEAGFPPVSRSETQVH